uniref:Uncharacterized protein n=1 Tax=Rhizophora mucronata TaxID=61149 RepID=A0A2P2Q9R2_RHIMU
MFRTLDIIALRHFINFLRNYFVVILYLYLCPELIS